MPCETRMKRRGQRRRGTGFWDRDQTISERKQEVREVVKTLDGYLVRGLAKVVIDPKTGAVAFTGFPESERGGVTDSCCYRQIMSTGSSLAKAAIARAEAMSGRTINKQAIAAGIHSHDGGVTFHAKG